jgi:hypothetical protein
VIKVSVFSGESARGPTVIPLFSPADGVFEKLASPTLMPEVVKYIDGLRPQNDAQYVLSNAMGASEYYGSNINGDAFPEASLIHAPDDWKGVPLYDRIRAKSWPYGFPTFYLAHPYAHHRNKDASRAFGEVELALWNPQMKRVELVIRVDKDKCLKFGGTAVWDKLKMGEFPDVSMGTRVPYDTCSICLDWDLYHKAVATFDPQRHKHPGEAALALHKKLQATGGKGIRGLSITRKDYCEHALKMMNKIFPDGRKVFVYNDYPRFFDISFVFIGADKTAKVMMKLAGDGKSFWFLGGAELAEKLGYDASVPYEEGEEKTASVDVLKMAFLGKMAKNKEGEIVKDVVPSQFAGKAVPVLTKNEPSLPSDLLDTMGSLPIEESLSTATGLGLILRPHEFQRMALVRMGMKGAADDLEDRNLIFPKVKDEEPISMGPDRFSIILARLLLPFLLQRSMLGPVIERRVVVISTDREDNRKQRSSLSSGLLHKIGAAYNSYRRLAMDMVANAQDLIASAAPSDGALMKIASAPVEEIFTPLSVAYLKTAFLDELGSPGQFEMGVKQALANSQRGEGFPLKERVTHENLLRRCL